MNEPTPATAPAQLVVVGSSAGGVEALSTLVGTLPIDFPAPIVIAQHLDPRAPSHLAEILSSRSRLPVDTILEHERLVQGHIYVVPADRNVTIVDGHLSLQAEHHGRPKPSINLLFSSAARVYGENLIGVILTGTGSDGAEGAQEIKKVGGIVVIQDPATASFPAMPRSLSPTSVDFVANISEIGALLHNLLTNAANLTPPGETKTLQVFLQQLHERSGLDFTSYKMPTIQRRLQRRMIATGSSSLAAYRRYLQRHPEEYPRLISSFLIKVTEFFRDRDLFTKLREEILPELIRGARQRGNELRLWSAGCATGEEAFSLAILVADLLGDELDRFTVRIFATDLDNDAIAFARRSIYPASSVVGLSSDFLARYFHRIDGDYEVQKNICNLVVFGQHDLGQRAPFPRIDLVLCRNVLIYFSMELQKRVLQLFAYSLRDQGYLILGKAETTSPLAEFFNPVQPALKVYRRQGERFPIPLSQFKDTTPLRPSSVNTSLLGIGSGMPLLLPREVSQARTAMEKLGNLVFNLPIGVVVVDRRYDIQIINSLAHQLLEIHRSAIGEDLLHLADQLPTKSLRSIIDTALRGDISAPATNILPIESESDNHRYLQVVGYPHQLDGEEGPIASVLLLISDVSEQVQRHNEIQLVAEESTERAIAAPPGDADAERLRLTEETARLTTQVQRLMAANRELRDANRDLTSTNVELHQANEEYLVNTEEIQAAAEEVETLNEELQATNEELETLNEELQATVEELNATNEDLEARSSELREMVEEREKQRKLSDTERAKLEAVLLGMNDGVLVVDTAGQPILTNQAYHEMFGDGTADLPLVDEGGVAIAKEERPRYRVARGETFSFILSLDGPARVSSDDVRWYEASGRPSTVDGVNQGGVVVFRDVTDRSLRRLQNEFVSMAAHELNTPLAAVQASLQQVIQALHERPAVTATKRTAAQQSVDNLPPEFDTALRLIRRMMTLVRDLADVRRLQTGKIDLHFQPVNLVEVVKQAVQAIQTLVPDHEIALKVPADVALIPGDAIRLEQIVFNLLMNAVIYAPNSPRINVRLREDKEAVELQVQDYGPGIPSDKFAQLFTAYYQGERPQLGSPGLGLGLYTAAELVKAHNGTISVSSQVGVGTTFTVTLPRETTTA